MKICFFGTGHGVPEAHKKCTATLLQVGENSYLFDAGCDVAYEMAEKRVKFDSLKALRCLRGSVLLVARNKCECSYKS